MNRSEPDQGGLQKRLHDLHFSTEGLSGFLEQVTVLAAETIDADTACGVTVIRDDHAATVAATEDRTKQLDEVQYGGGDGPCLEAARSGRDVTIHDLQSETRWPDYRTQALDVGMRSSLSIPLQVGDDAAGALNMYVFEPTEFDAQTRAVLGQFCLEASRAISLSLRHDRLSQQNDHLHAAMATRRVIDQALGMLMAQNRSSSDQAFAMLRRASQDRNVRIRDLAAEMVRTETGTEPSSQTHWKA